MKTVICYVSTVNPFLTQKELQQLFSFVTNTNKKLGITGVLIHAEGNFFQIIEGETTTIHSLFERIQQDTRHYDIITILNKPIYNSSFDDYECSFTVISTKKDREKLDSFLEKEKLNNPQSFGSIAYIAQKFIGKY
ncbi:BLUF domain-containing protein [Aquimarina brevivitae]|uniref:FAD-dependent sensor of blue light n=1 Tax=Aquimarina brevivitae TaxID=323412 RepID=A0A4Q7NXI9_9FLAO|nr:BLUF domain-containing protein [Aquimarina brevivitae]RZS91995.1 FAD-dependent sensor of blue light [Aquimarina brevivitae]